MFAIAAFNLLNVKRAKDAIIAEKKRIEDEKKAAEKAAEEKAKAEAAAIEAAKPAGLPKDADEKPVYLQDLSSVSFVIWVSYDVIKYSEKRELDPLAADFIQNGDQFLNILFFECYHS